MIMQRPDMSANFQVPITTAIIIILTIKIIEYPEIPIFLAGPISTVLVVTFSIITRLGLFRSLLNTGPDLAFCSVGLQLSLLYRRLEESTTSNQSYMGWDVIFVLIFLISWMGSLILVRYATKKKKRFGLNLFSLGATFLGILSIALQIYLRMWYQL